MVTDDLFHNVLGLVDIVIIGNTEDQIDTPCCTARNVRNTAAPDAVVWHNDHFVVGCVDLNRQQINRFHLSLYAADFDEVANIKRTE